MDNAKKLAFVHAMTNSALLHMQKTPNMPVQDGKMSHDKMAAFVAAQTKHGLQHFDIGGAVQPGSDPLTGAGSNAPSSTESTTGIGGLGAAAIPPGIQNDVSHIPVVGGAIASGLNPLGMLQGATQNGFQASAAPIQAGTNAAQLNTAYGQAQTGIGQAQGLASSTAPGANQGLSTQQALANQLALQSQGQGPNPAQAALNLQTGQNVANQAALMAGARGASANPGLIAREAAMQGAATQQNAIGQSAELQAQQQLAAQQEAANLAATQVNQAGQATNNYNTAAQNEQNILQGANSAFNNANVSSVANQNNVNAAISQGNQAASNNLLGGITNGLGGAISSMFAEGGEVESNLGSSNYTPVESGGSANIGSVSSVNEGNPFAPPPSSGGGGGGGGAGLGGLMAIAAMAKGGEVELPDHLHHMASIYHPNRSKPMMLKAGGSVPGKPQVNHDDYKNDTVPAMLTPGEVVIDLDTLHRNDELGKKARFVAKHLAKKPLMRKGGAK